MTQLIFKLVKWIVSMSALICAIKFMGVFGDTNDITYMAVILPCLALVFWFSKSTYEASKPVMIRGFAVLAIAGVTAYAGIPYIVGYIDVGFFMAWELIMLVIGIPAMLHAFIKDK